MDEILIEEATEATREVVDALARLIPQLSTSSPPPSAVAVTEIVNDPRSVLFVARRNGEIIGTLTLATFSIPTATRAWIEDVVVDDSARGSGAASALTQAALDAARSFGAATVELTSRPSREAANRLYQKLGFERRDTNVYRYDLRN